MHTFTNLSTTANGRPGINHSAFIYISTDIYVRGHEYYIFCEVCTITGNRMRYRTYSQFFIVLKDSKFLDGQYTVFGKVVAGMDEVVDKIAALDTDSADAPLDDGKAKMLKITVTES